MRYQLRRAASISVALVILVGLPLGGGAWLSGSGTAEEPASSSTVTAASVGGSPAVSEGRRSTAPDSASGAPLSQPDLVSSGADWICTFDDTHPGCLPPSPPASVPTTAAPVPAVGGEAGPVSLLGEGASREAPELERLVPLDPQSAEDWRGLIELFFLPADVDRAVNIVECESRGRPDAKNPRSTASGLFQHLASLWPDRAAAAGYAGADVFDPVANTAVAAWLVYDGGGWSHWNASRGCW